MVSGYKHELQIDRIDNEKGYSPDNCRWVTRSVQNRNRRMTEKWREGNRRNAAKGRAAQAASGWQNLVKARAVLAAKRAAAKAAREGVAV